MENSFWNKHYQVFSVQKPSDFSLYCINKYLKKEDRAIELGCGNGRDGIGLAKVVANYVGIDACPVAIESFLKKVNQNQNIDSVNVELVKDDFTNIDFRKFVKNNERLVIYSRFSLHSINYDEANRLLRNIENIDSPWVFMFESRTIFDEFYGVGKELGQHEFESDHYRRFIDPAEFLQEISGRFNVKYFEVADGFAKFSKEDPIVMRVVIESKLNY